MLSLLFCLSLNAFMMSYRLRYCLKVFVITNESNRAWIFRLIHFNIILKYNYAFQKHEPMNLVPIKALNDFSSKLFVVNHSA